MFKFTRTLIMGATVILPLAMAAAPAHAGTTTGTFAVKATVVNSCVLGSTGNLVFTGYDPTSSTALTGSTSISVTCTKNDAYVIGLSYGTNGGSATNRIMSDGATPTANTLNYNLYTDSGHNNVWKDSSTCNNPASPGSNCDGGTGAGPTSPANYTVYGQIPAQQNVPAGTYNDTITITVTF